MAGDDGQDIATGTRLTAGRRFWKMTGSGNDFVFVDGREDGGAGLDDPTVIQRICARGTGVGADGLVILVHPREPEANIGIRYFNSDGSIASLCGNATLCTASLAARLGAVDPAGFELATGTGVLTARIRSGLPEFDFPPMGTVHGEWAAVKPESAEVRLGFAVAGIPHVVIRVDDVQAVDLTRRGRQVRYDRSFPDGANVNFVGPDVASDGASDGSAGWRMRTYERGVEAETLACGTGSVATAILLRTWGEAGPDVELKTASGRVLGIRSEQLPDGGWRASLRGEGRLVFEGELRDL